MRTILLLCAIATGCGDDDVMSPDGGRATDSGQRDGGGGGDDGGGEDDGGTPIPGRGCPGGIATDPDLMQALPRITDLDTAYPTQAGTTISVTAGGDLQAAIDMAMPGDTIELEAGATFTGPFTLREKSGDGWIVIRTATPDAMLPPEGTRVRPSQAGLPTRWRARAARSP